MKKRHALEWISAQKLEPVFNDLQRLHDYMHEVKSNRGMMCPPHEHHKFIADQASLMIKTLLFAITSELAEIVDARQQQNPPPRQTTAARNPIDDGANI